MDKIEKWLSTNDLKINYSKSGILIPKVDHRTPSYPKKFLKDIPVVEKYKYLGVTIDMCLTFQFSESERQA